ncbi:MAG TPA: hypothetical protein PLJ29_11740 [Leptospiraceae bacterium]|nr:hypothetical protein [Leptospiraceae bacterium]
MKTDKEIRLECMKILFANIDIAEAEKFISLIQREKFDHTEWRQGLYDGLSVRELSRKAIPCRESKKEFNLVHSVLASGCTNSGS